MFQNHLNEIKQYNNFYTLYFEQRIKSKLLFFPQKRKKNREKKLNDEATNKNLYKLLSWFTLRYLLYVR
jgi:hypothetical protein